MKESDFQKGMKRNPNFLKSGQKALKKRDMLDTKDLLSGGQNEEEMMGEEEGMMGMDINSYQNTAAIIRAAGGTR